MYKLKDISHCGLHSPDKRSQGRVLHPLIVLCEEWLEAALETK